MSDKNKIQVTEGYYNKNSYNTLERFVSYYYQIDVFSKLEGVNSILEIGPGNKLVSRELSSLGYNVTTCDFDEHVEPDIISDVRNLPTDRHYDAIMACQILEHIPYTDFEKVLKDFHKISNKYVIISLPNRSVGFLFLIKFPFIQTLCKCRFFSLSFQIPLRLSGFEESGQHYWEIDYWTVSLKRVRRSFSKYFTIEKEFSNPIYPYHKFFILKKR